MNTRRQWTYLSRSRREPADHMQGPFDAQVPAKGHTFQNSEKTPQNAEYLTAETATGRVTVYDYY